MFSNLKYFKVVYTDDWDICEGRIGFSLITSIKPYFNAQTNPLILLEVPLIHPRKATGYMETSVHQMYSWNQLEIVTEEDFNLQELADKLEG